MRILTRWRRRPGPRRGGDDRGSVLLLTLATVVLAGAMAVPLADYAATMQRAGRTVNDKAQHVEAAKAGLRLALADPTSLYDTCDAAGITVGVEIATPGWTPASRRPASRWTRWPPRPRASSESAPRQRSSARPCPPACSATRMPARSAAVDAWQADTTSTGDGRQDLVAEPARALDELRSPSGHLMPAGFPACRVYFPGTYVDPVTITSSTPTYFASGTYLLHRPLRISGNANVLFGGGSYEGCISDQEAAFYATDAPTIHNIKRSRGHARVRR